MTYIPFLSFKKERSPGMKVCKGVFALLVFSMMVAGSALADMQCHQGVGGYDPWGNWYCAYTSGGGTCLFCFDEIIVKG